MRRLRRVRGVQDKEFTHQPPSVYYPGLYSLISVSKRLVSYRDQGFNVGDSRGLLRLLIGPKRALFPASNFLFLSSYREVIVDSQGAKRKRFCKHEVALAELAFIYLHHACDETPPKGFVDNSRRRFKVVLK